MRRRKITVSWRPAWFDRPRRAWRQVMRLAGSKVTESQDKLDEKNENVRHCSLLPLCWSSKGIGSHQTQALSSLSGGCRREENL